MRAFFGSEELKATKLDQVRAHEAADEIVKGLYWEKGKGCAVGCTIHGSNHAAYETELGVPRMLARLEDRIFEGMSNAEAKRFPARFIEAIPVGADLSRVGWKFLHWLIADATERHATARVKEKNAPTIEILRKKSEGEAVARSEITAARSAASAGRRAAVAAAAAYAAYAADAADAADAAADARGGAFDRQAKKLLEMLVAAPVSAARL